MKIKKILITGGAGFIGSHLTEKLIEQKYKVRILDNLTPQVHEGKIPHYLNDLLKNKFVDFIKGDVTNLKDIKRAIEGVDAIFHFAAAVGVGQSMYEIERYVNNNIYGTAKILDFLANNKHSIKRLLIASSMTAYGEGLYRCKICGAIRPQLRSDDQMRKKIWEPLCLNCKNILTPLLTPETEPFHPNSIYALTKQCQEDMLLIFGKTYGIPVTVLRYFNVYGPRQSLSNPYTGVTAIFLSRLKNNKSPIIYEDGLQTRDFVSVYDVAEANSICLESEESFGQVFNVGTGKPTTIKKVAQILSNILGKKIEPEITGKFRSGDVRHCTADISLIIKTLGWSPKWNFENGMEDLIKWGEKEDAKDLFEKASKELKSKGLLKS